MKTVSQFLKSVGRQDFRLALDLPEQSLTRAVSENIMPSGWYIGTRDFCAARGFDTPDHLFRWSHEFRALRDEQVSP